MSSSGTAESRAPDPTGRKARLLIWTDGAPPRGICVLNHALARGMAARDFDLTIVGPMFDPSERQSDELRGIRHIAVTLPEERGSGPPVLTPEASAALVREISPDVVLFADASAVSNLVAKTAVAALGLPMIFSLAMVSQQHAKAAQADPAFEPLFGAARRVVCASHHDQKILREHYPIGDAQPTLILGGRPDSFFRPIDDARRAAVRATLGLSPEEVLFLTTARIEASKGFGLFVLALKALRDTPVWPRLRFAWAGDGSARIKVAELLESEKIVERVRLLGARSDVAALLDAADAFVLPSYAEGMPLAIMEAMAKGLPVIASAVGGVPEQLGDAGILIQDPSASPAAAGTGLIQAIVELATTPGRRVELGHQAKQRAEILFREDRMVTDYWRLIADAAPTARVKPHDYVSPGFDATQPDAGFPTMIKGNTGESVSTCLRRSVPHHWYVDRRYPAVGFLTRDEAHIAFNTAGLFAGKAALQIGGFMGWSTCHLALGGTRLDVIDPILADASFRASVEAALSVNGVRDRVKLVPARSPAAVESLAADGRRWSLIFVDGDREGDAPRHDVAAVEPFAAEDCIILFHDLATPSVANAVRYLRARGWQIRLYRTMQIMAAAWRGRIAPPDHIPDPTIDWSLPFHLADLVNEEFGTIHRRAAPHTMTSMARQFALYQAVNFTIDREVPGDIVECGVWRGGSMMIAALSLLVRGASDRRLTLYDTFDGMTPPTAEDVEASSGQSAGTILATLERIPENYYWALAPLDQVKANLASTAYPAQQIDYVAGDVCQTLPLRRPRPIALLRLDTDWYASTRCELECLYAQLMPGGVLIVDDYGHWEGARRACDEFFARQGGVLRPIPDDYTGYWLVKGPEELSQAFMRRLRLA